MSRHESRQKLAREFGATDIVTERGDEGVTWIKDLTKGIGADSVLECVGTQESMMQAIQSTRPGGFVSYVGVPHAVSLDGAQFFFEHVHLHGGPAPVRRYLPQLIELILNGKINPGKVLTWRCLDQVAEGYRAMDERRAIKALLLPFSQTRLIGSASEKPKWRACQIHHLAPCAYRGSGFVRWPMTSLSAVQRNVRS